MTALFSSNTARLFGRSLPRLLARSRENVACSYPTGRLALVSGWLMAAALITAGLCVNVRAQDAGETPADETPVAQTPAADTPVVVTPTEETPVVVAPRIAVTPVGGAIETKGTMTFTVTATGSDPMTYQWLKDGVAIDGATSATLTVSKIFAPDAGNYTVQVTNGAGTVTSEPAVMKVLPPSRLANVSLRASTGTGTTPVVMGYALGGEATTGTKPLLLRAVGPGLTAFGLAGVQADPQVSVFHGDTSVAADDDWSAADKEVMTSASAFALTEGSHDAAVVTTTGAGVYSAQITGKGAAGTVLAELYDATTDAANTASTPRLTNVSALSTVPTGSDGLIAGFAIVGNSPKAVLIRAVGPTLAQFGVSTPVADPKLEIFAQGSTTAIGGNDNWAGTPELSNAFVAVGAFALPADSKDAAMVVTLQPGVYTAKVTGTAAGTGLVEFYELP